MQQGRGKREKMWEAVLLSSADFIGMDMRLFGTVNKISKISGVMRGGE